MVFTPTSVLNVFAFDELVGALAPSNRRGLYAFEYAESWRRKGIELSPALMKVSDRKRNWIFPGLATETFHGLPPLVADSLPDRFGNAIINAALAREGATPDQISPLDRLAYLGSRGMGALTYVPAIGPESPEPTSIALAELVTAARGALHGDLEAAPEHALNDLLSVGSSAGGARAKAVVAWNRSTNELRTGNLPVPDEFEQWLLKFDGVSATDKGRSFGEGQEYGRIEYAYSTMARAAGIDMPETSLIEEGGRAHFLIRRFDRPKSGRLHMQTLCALDTLDYNLIATNDYASLMVRTISLDDSPQTRQEVFRRIAFNVLSANNDDHTKNHSFLMSPDGSWQLSPAYDVTFAHDLENRWLKQHLMSVGGKFSEITKRDLMDFADRFNVPDARGILRRVEAAIADWVTHAKGAGATPARTAEIAKALTEIREAAN